MKLVIISSIVSQIYWRTGTGTNIQVLHTRSGTSSSSWWGKVQENMAARQCLQQIKTTSTMFKEVIIMIIVLVRKRKNKHSLGKKNNIHTKLRTAGGAGVPLGSTTWQLYRWQVSNSHLCSPTIIPPRNYGLHNFSKKQKRKKNFGTGTNLKLEKKNRKIWNSRAGNGVFRVLFPVKWTSQFPKSCVLGI